MSLARHSTDFSPLRTSPQRNDNWRHQKAHPDGSSGPPTAHAAQHVLPRGAQVPVLLPFRGVPCLENWQQISHPRRQAAREKSGPREHKEVKINDNSNMAPKAENFFPFGPKCVSFPWNRSSLLPAVWRLQPVCRMSERTGLLLFLSQPARLQPYVTFGLMTFTVISSINPLKGL